MKILKFASPEWNGIDLKTFKSEFVICGVAVTLHMVRMDSVVFVVIP